MPEKTFYNAILADTTTFDKVIVHLESILKETDNRNIQLAARQTLADINLVLSICTELKKKEK